MKLIGKIEHKLRNFKLLSKTGLRRIEGIAKKIELKRIRLERDKSFSY